MTERRFPDEIPVDPSGNLLRTAVKYNGNELLTIPNEPYTGTLTLVQIVSDRESPTVLFRRADGRLCTMFLVDLNKILVEDTLTLTGTWQTRKHGTGYGVVRLEEDD